MQQDLLVLSVTVESLIKISDKLISEIDLIRPVLQEKADRRSLEELRDLFQELRLNVQRLDLLLTEKQSALASSKQAKQAEAKRFDEEVKLLNDKIQKLEMSVWKLGLLSAGAGSLGGLITKLLEEALK